MEKIKKYAYYITIFIILLISFYLRTRFYIVDNVFEDDECRLAIPLFSGTFWDMILPLGAFSSSPVVMVLSKFIVNTIGFNEHALKFISYFASLVSLGMFFKLTKEYFKSNISVCIANFLFAVNFNLIYFSATFKTYSLEVLFTILCLYYLPKINIAELKLKQLIILSLIISVMPLISLPGIFFIVVLFITNTFKNYNIKDYYKHLPIILIPFCTLMFLYYKFNLSIVKKMQLQAYADFWNNEIFGQSAISTLSNFWGYITDSNCLIIIPLILLISYITILFSKKQFKNTDIWITLILLFAIIASTMHFYPIYNRTGVYLIPLLILFPVKIIDILDYKKIYYYIFLAGLIYSFSYYFNINNYGTVLRPENTLLSFSPKNLMLDMKNRYNKNTDVVLINKITLYSFLYYKTVTGFDTDNVVIIPSDRNTDKQTLFEFLNNLNPDYNYWIYIIKDINNPPLYSYLSEWLGYQNTEYGRTERASYLYYVKAPVKKLTE